MLKDLFRKQRKYAIVPNLNTKKDVPEGIVQKCPHCSNICIAKEFIKNLKVCKLCGYHSTLNSSERIELILDKDSFFEFDTNLKTKDPLSFPNYKAKIKADIEKTKLNEAVVTGKGTLDGVPIVIGAMDSRFRMGSMGSVVGEKIARAALKANELKVPFILFSASGGARMQEGVLSLMQMAKTSAALQVLQKNKILFISIFTNPTTGGVSASFSSLGDINLAEPGALIGFAGRRVIEQTVRESLPKDFQTSEFLFKHGQLDKIVERQDLRKTLASLVAMHSIRKESYE